MGSSHSTSQLEIPLHAQSPPVLATPLGSATTEFTSLCVTSPPTSGGLTLRVVDSTTQRHAYDFTFSSQSTRSYRLQTPDGRPLLRVDAQAFSKTHQVYEGDTHEPVSFEVRVDGFARLAVYADFHDRHSGRACRVLLDGGSYDRVVVFYLEYGSPELRPLPKRAELTNPHRFQAIGRMRRPERNVTAAHQYFVDAAPGVDLTLLLLLWQEWEQLRRERRRQDD